MSVDRRRARQKRRGKADLRYIKAAGHLVARAAAGALWRCPQCGTRDYKIIETRKAPDSVKPGEVVRLCRNGHGWKAVA